MKTIDIPIVKAQLNNQYLTVNLFECSMFYNFQTAGGSNLRNTSLALKIV